MIKQHAITDLHGIAHKVACLIVAHTCPGNTRIFGGQGIVDAYLIRLGFHQPIAHLVFVVANEKAVAA
jgi:hypothetical protein